MALVQTTIRLPKEIYATARACAAEVGVSFNAFAAEAVASRIKNWRNPITGRRSAPKHDPKTKGKWCIACNVQSSACKNEGLHSDSLWTTPTPRT